MRKITPQIVSTYVDRQLVGIMRSEEAAAVQAVLRECLLSDLSLPMCGQWFDIDAFAEATRIDKKTLHRSRKVIQPIFDAVCQTIVKNSHRATSSSQGRKRSTRKYEGLSRSRRAVQKSAISIDQTKRRPELPRACTATGAKPTEFSRALSAQMQQHGDTPFRLHKALLENGVRIDRHALAKWCIGRATPRSASSFEILKSIELRYGLLPDGLRGRIGKSGHATFDGSVSKVPRSERRRLAWHLPDDFDLRPADERREILKWVRTVVISGATDYRSFQAIAMRHPFAVRFDDGGRRSRTRLLGAPADLQAEMNELLRFKTSTLTSVGSQRNGVWGSETANQKVEHFGLLFGAFAASPKSSVQGFGAPLSAMTFAILVFPRVWDWYLAWRERRRGFYTASELDMLAVISSLVRRDTGWLRQTPTLAMRLQPIEGLISPDDVAFAQGDWNAACDVMHSHARVRDREVSRVSRVHRDPFEPILAVLESASPLASYKKIAEEIERRMPNERLYPRAAAEAVRSFLMLRLGMHTGLRQKNLRELLVCLPGDPQTSERRLEEQRRGELRWNSKVEGWEVLIPAIAFKNASSSFFGSKPFKLLLPDLSGLYAAISAWLDRHRKQLLGPALDPGTFFVKTVKRTSANAEYDQNTFYEAWRLAIQRYGIYNPYTEQGAIEGLLPHGPHSVRDVLATHVLKQTGSYEQASYAIQDTPEMVAKHYGRFLPQDKAAIAARVLNQVWAGT